MSKQILLLAVFMILGIGNQVQAEEAETKCWIWITTNSKRCPLSLGDPRYYKPNQYFADTDSVANSNAARCLERAAEYKNWCSDGRRIKATAAYAYFYVGNHAVISAHALDDGKTYIHDGVGRYTRFKD